MIADMRGKKKKVCRSYTCAISLILISSGSRHSISQVSNTRPATSSSVAPDGLKDILITFS